METLVVSCYTLDVCLLVSMEYINWFEKSSQYAFITHIFAFISTDIAHIWSS
jgi:hypothetical protein